MKYIAHIDVDAFFASVEETLDKSLHNIPFAIANNTKDGIISTANYHARKLGIHSAMLVSDAIRIYPDLKVIKANLSLYRKISYELFDILYKRVSNQIEIASIDECFLDITEELKDVDQNILFFVSDIKNIIKRETGLNISIGVGPNKYIAKLLTNFSKPNGLLIYDEKIFLKNSILHLNQINKSDLEHLKSLGINNFEDFCNPKNEKIIIPVVGRNRYYKISNLLLNKAFDPLTINFNKPNQISETCNFNPDCSEIKVINQEIKRLIKNLLDKKELNEYFYDTVAVYYKQNRKIKRFSRKINDYKNINTIILKLFLDNWDEKAIDYIGISLINPIPKKQSNLFDFI